MAGNEVLLNAGAYAQFTSANTHSQVNSVYKLLSQALEDLDATTLENIEKIYEMWNHFIEVEYADEKEKWQIDFEKVNTQQSTKVDEGKIDYSQWVDNSEDTSTSSGGKTDSLVSQLQDLQIRVINTTDKVEERYGE